MDVFTEVASLLASLGRGKEGCRDLDWLTPPLPSVLSGGKDGAMQLVAYIGGKRIDATQMPHADWRGLADTPVYPRMVLQECGKRAIRNTRRGRQFSRTTLRAAAVLSTNRNPSSTC